MARPPAVHRSAARGFAANADGYARGRPDYPLALDDWLRDPVGLAPGRVVADVGAGTGKFVPRLVATGAGVVAVEPVDAMRALLADAYPAIDARAGTADALPFSDGEVDAIVCAQAFHWFADPATMREFARVIRPGGTLALVWNVRDESLPWVRRLTAIMAPYEGDTPRAASGAWRAVFPAPGFGPLQESVFSHGHVGSPEHVVVDRILSVSFIAALPERERTKVAAQLSDVIASEPWFGGRAIVEFPYRTIACLARRE